MAVRRRIGHDVVAEVAAPSLPEAHPMQQDTPDLDKAARTIAENVYAAFTRMATTSAAPLAEQTVLTRLVEAIRPQVSGGSVQAIVDAANSALDAWEQREQEVRGPRVEAVDLRDGAVTMRRRG